MKLLACTLGARSMQLSFTHSMIDRDWQLLNVIERDWLQLNGIDRDWPLLNVIDHDWPWLTMIDRDCVPNTWVQDPVARTV